MKSGHFKLLLSFAVLVLIIAGVYYFTPNRSSDHDVHEIAEALPESKPEQYADVSLPKGRPNNLTPSSDGAAIADVTTAPEAQPAPLDRPTDTPVLSTSDQYRRYGEITAEHAAWLRRNKYPDDAHRDLLRAMDEASLRVLLAQGDLAAQSELAYRLSRNADTAKESAELFDDAVIKGSKEALVRNAESLEQAAGGCVNNIQGNAYLQVAAILGDLNAAARYSLCVSGMSPTDHTLTLLLASKLFATLNSEALRRTGRPLQVDTHPMIDQAINQIVAGGKQDEANGSPD